MMKRRYKLAVSFLCFIIAVILVFPLLELPVQAQQVTHTVRVGVYPLDRFHSFDTDGSCVGYDVDYLERISGYTGWDYEFVCAQSWSEAIDMLRNGEIDLLSPSQITTTRLEEFSFSTFPIGKVYAAILALQNSSIIYEDYEAFGSMIFGIEEGNTYGQIFEEYAQLHGFTPNVRFFPNQSALVAALHSGMVDAIIANVMRAEPDMKLLGKAGTAQYYYMYRKGDLALGNALNNALNQIEIAAPNFQDDLVSKYFPIYNEDPFTKAELDYIATLPTFTAGVWDDSRPLSYTDPQTGAITGITVSLLDQISQRSGLQFNYVSMSRQNTNLEDFKTAGLAFMADVRNNEHNQSKFNQSLSISYFQSQAVLVARHGGFSSQKMPVMAIADCSDNLKEIISDSFPGYEYRFYESEEAAFIAVANGNADCVLANQYIVDYELHKPKFEALEAIPNSGYSEEFSLMWLEQDPNVDVTMLMSIVNKSIHQIGNDEVQQSVLSYTTAMPYQLSSAEVCYKYRVPLSVIALLMLFVILLSAAFVVDRNQKLLIIRQTNEALEQKSAQLAETNQELESKNLQLSEAVQQANRANRAKSEFLARMSHEIRTPMNAIIGETTIAQKSLSNEVKVSQCLNKVSLSSRHLLNLINDILDMSAIESNKIKLARARFDMKEVVGTITTLYYSQCSAKQIHFESRLSGMQYEFLLGDQLRLQQIILNLLSNAVKFTAPGGNIRFFMQEQWDGSRLNLHIVIRDTGCGMSEEFMGRVFKPFEQGNPLTAQEHGGSGLGLSISKNLVELMGGHIELASTLHVGTTFTLDIPMEIAPEQTQLQNQSIAQMRAILIDDDPDALEYAGSILSHIGLEYDCAESGEQAQKIITKARNDKRMYDLCMIDWKMSGISGLELTRRIRYACGDKPIVVIASAYDLNEIQDEADTAGVDACIAKPLFQSSVFNLLNQLVEGRLVKRTADCKDFDFTGKRVLLVDDNELNREIACELLEMVGFSVDTANDGLEGSRKFIDSAPDTYNAVLMDVQMPVMNGYDAARRIRASSHPQAASVFIFAMTANAFSDDIANSLEAGMNDHLTKPIDTEIMYQVLDHYLNQK